MIPRKHLSNAILPLVTGIALAFDPTLALADAIAAQPIGFLGKDEKSSDPSDFFVIIGRGRGGQAVNKLVFNARVKDLGEDGEVRKWYVQQIEPSNDPTVRFYLIDRNAPAKPLGSFKLAQGAKVQNFI